MTGTEHALKASELLTAVDQLQSHLEGLDADQRMQLAVTGGFTRMNANTQFTVELANAHALTALALLEVDRRPAWAGSS